MKSNNLLKNLLIISLSVFCLGLALFGFGKVSGGSVDGMSLGDSGFYVIDDNFGLSFSWGGSNVSKETININQVKEIHINTACATINIDGDADSNVLEYSNFRVHEVDVKYENGIIDINAGGQKCRNNKTASIDLSFKQTDIIDKVVIKTNVGDIDIEDLKAASFDINNDVGRVALDEVVSDGLIASTGPGEITIKGDLRNTSTIKSAVGSIYVETVQPKSAYYYDASVNLGSLTVDGAGSDNPFGGNQTGGDSKTAKNKIYIEANIGDADLYFTDN